MSDGCFGNNWVHMYVAELTSRIVAESGIPSDRFHLGKIILQSLKDEPDLIMQIDGATGESETNGSVLKKTIRCATSLRQMGLKKDDVMVLMAPNHLDLVVPFYAGLCLGLAVAPTDRTMNAYDLRYTFEVVKPRIVFCQSDRVQDVQKAVESLKMDTIVISFDKSSHTLCFYEMLDKYGEEIDVHDFKVTDFDPEETIALLISTSGTTGLPKAATLTHKNMAISSPYIWCVYTKFPAPTRLKFLIAPVQWLSTLLNFVISPVLKYTRLQTSAQATPQHICHLISKYKPTYFNSCPTMMATIIKTVAEENSDFSSLETLVVSGNPVSPEFLQQIRKMLPNIQAHDVYGMTELGSLAFSCGQRMGHLQYRLVDVETKEDIKVPNKCGELCLKGPGVFREYYNNPTATKEAFTEDGWFKTGDLMYRNESWNFYYVDRIKLILNYRDNQISPAELETVIRQHPGVLDVAVTGINAEFGDLPVACVVPRPGCQPTVQEIKDLVKDSLADYKQLRGGVVFMTELPLTPSTKLDRRKLKEIVMERINELTLQTDQ